MMKLIFLELKHQIKRIKLIKMRRIGKSDVKNLGDIHLRYSRRYFSEPYYD